MATKLTFSALSQRLPIRAIDLVKYARFLAILLVATCATGAWVGEAIARQPVLKPGSPRCKLLHDRETLFMGSKECFKTLPLVRMQGRWVIDQEQSEFFESKSHRAEPDLRLQGGAWLDVNVAEAIRPTGIQVDGRHHEFDIVFIGRRGPTPGIYGHMGQYRSGIYVERIVSIKSIE